MFDAAGELPILPRRPHRPADSPTFIDNIIPAAGSGSAVSYSDAIRGIINECAENLRDLALAKMLLSKVRAPVYINPELGANEGLDKMVDTIKSSMLSCGELLQARVREIESTLPDVTTDFERRWATNKLNLVPAQSYWTRY